jgi:hypothetical protein
MASLTTYLRSLRSKPRSFHVGLVLAFAWVPLLIYFAGYSTLATIVLIVLAVVFLTIHPVTFIAPNPPADRPQRQPAANDE